jgi:hypothetical protein
MKSIFRTLTVASIVCLVSEFAFAQQHGGPVGGFNPPTLGAPGPEIGDGVVGFAVAAVVLFAVLMLPRVKRLLQARAA